MATKEYELGNPEKKQPAVIQSLKAGAKDPFSAKEVNLLQASEAAKKGEWRLAVWCEDMALAKSRAKDLNARACIGERVQPELPKHEEPGAAVQQMVDWKPEKPGEPKKVKAGLKAGEECPTCKGKKVVENQKAVYDCPDCGEKMAVKPTPDAKPSLKAGEAFQEVTGDEPFKVVDLVTGGESYFSEKVDAYKMAAIIKNRLGHEYRIEFREPDAVTTVGSPEVEAGLKAAADPAVLIKALEFYADPENWEECVTGIGMIPSEAVLAGHVTAQEALEAYRGAAGEQVEASGDDEDWDTEEVCRWIANDEGLYRLARRAYNARTMEELLKPAMEGNANIRVEWDDVNWEAVYADMDNADTDAAVTAKKK